jgi:hypothetical protein
LGVPAVCGVAASLCLLSILWLGVASPASAADAPKPTPEVLWEEYPLHSAPRSGSAPSGNAPAPPERATPAAPREPESSTVALVLFLSAFALLAAVALVGLTRLVLRIAPRVRLPRPRVSQARRQPTAGDRA